MAGIPIATKSLIMKNILKIINTYPTNKSLVNYLFYLIVVIYVYSMIIHPWIVTDFNWNQVQSIWDRWQGFNVGMLAFISSVIAFGIAKFNNESQRKREFLSARAFLPDALSELTDYLKTSGQYLNGLNKKYNILLVANNPCPTLPDGYKKVFENCIKHANPEIGNYLANILSKLQVFDARIRPKQTPTFNHVNYVRTPNDYELIGHIFDLGELACFIFKAFSIGRGCDTSLEYPDWEYFVSTYNEIDIFPENYVIQDSDFSLEWKTKQKIKENSKSIGAYMNRKN